MPHEYVFDLTLTATVTLTAVDETTARAVIRDRIDGTSANLGAWPNGDPILCEVGIEGALDLSEVDGDFQ